MKLLEAELDNKKFIIEEDYPDVGYYLSIYENGKCIKDYLQDNLVICKKIALEDYGVPQDKWQIRTRETPSMHDDQNQKN